MMPKTIYLTGIMGAGKTSIGKRFAKISKLTFVDLDDWIVVREGMSVSYIFEKYGESRWRELEHDALRDSSLVRGSVIATGGGIVISEENRKFMLDNGIVVWIDRNIDSYIKKIRTESRPLLKNGAEPLKRIYSEREGFYKQCNLRFHNRYKNPDAAARMMKKLLKQRRLI